jgi:hypothetical protein
MLDSIAKIAAVFACAASGTADAWAQEATAPIACSLAFDSTSLNAQSNKGEFRGIRVSCAELSISADEATASEVVPEKGEWQMHGSVRVEVASAIMTADSATFGFSASGLVLGELVGDPVVIEDFDPQDRASLRARATATRIRYDNVARVARITMDESSALVGTNFEMRGCGDIDYALDSGAVESVSTCGEPFEITYLPSAEEPSPDDAPTVQ